MGRREVFRLKRKKPHPSLGVAKFGWGGFTNIFVVSGLDSNKQKVTANMDVYIKTDNRLAISLDTNNVSFEDYSGISAIELKDAVEITVNTSLPYNLNAYMPTKILNANGSQEISMDKFNIKESQATSYQQFRNTTEKIVLKSNCEKGDDKKHSIDLKLSANGAHVADIYKTTIKFEVEQQ